MKYNTATTKSLLWIGFVVLFGVSALFVDRQFDRLPDFINSAIVVYAIFNAILIFLSIRKVERERVGNASASSMLARMTPAEIKRIPRREDRFLFEKTVLKASDVLARGGKFNVTEFLEPWRVRLLAPIEIAQVAIAILPMAGFLGTVLGLTTSLGSMAETIESSGDVDAIKSSMIEMISGMKFCFDSTIFGLCGAMILKPLVRNLESTVDEMFSDIISQFGNFGEEEDIE